MRKIALLSLILIAILNSSCFASVPTTNHEYQSIIKDGNLTPLNAILSDNDLQKLSKSDLRILRNTIFAKYGYIFYDDDLVQHFSHFTWYKPVYKDVTALLNDTDKMNITEIQAVENSGKKVSKELPVSGTADEPTPGTLSYAGVERVASPSVVTVNDIEQYKKLIKDYDIKVILYTKSAFYFEKNAVMYTIGSNGYKNLADYENGNESGFNNGDSYYFAKANKLSTQQDVDYYRAQNYLTSVDFFDAKSMGLINNDVTNKISTVIGLITSDNLTKFARYINVLLLAANGETITDSAVNKTDPYYIINHSNGYIKQFGTMYYLSIPVNYRGNRNSYYYNRNTNSLIGDDALFYYALKVCQYTNIADYIAITGTNNYKGIMNSNGGNHYDIKNNEQLTTGLGYKTYPDFEDSMRRKITNSKDYYVVKQYD
jgi:hypothetical protein